jgi:D-alanine-D-alanine ligase
LKVAVAYNEPVKGNLDSEDVLEEVQLVTESLSELGWVFKTFPVHSGPGFLLKILSGLEEFSPDVVFNLVEAIGENQRFHPAMAGALEMAGYPYTGAPYDALLVTTDKALAKCVMRAHGIPTPDWQVFKGSPVKMNFGPPWFVKPAWEDASIGIDDTCIIKDEVLLRGKLALMGERHPAQPILIEKYIEGRELNIAMLGIPGGGAEAFKVAELLFEDWPEGKPKIINYAAKWFEDSLEYENTPRVFNPMNAPLEEIKEMVLKAWDLFNLKGYARADMRMDPDGKVYILEMNANPCIGPWSGYISAAKEMGYSPAQVIKRIIESALSPEKARLKAVPKLVRETEA